MKKKHGRRLSPLGAEIVSGLSEFCDAIESGEPVSERFTIRTVRLAGPHGLEQGSSRHHSASEPKRTTDDG